MELVGLTIAEWTPAALLSLAVLLILVGKLVPRSTLDDKIKESEKWQKAYETSEAARALSDAQTTKLLEVTEATYSVLVALKENAEYRASRQSGGVDASVSSSS